MAGSPASVVVGTSGARCVRWRPVTASALILPCFTSGASGPTEDTISCTSFPISAVRPMACPLYGM